MHSKLRFIVLIPLLFGLMPVLSVTPAIVGATESISESGELTLWITADIEGYLTGCDCPDGASAGLSAVALYLDENRDSDSQPLLDAGGMRESGRPDPLLERFIDEAILDMGYSGLIVVSSDLRDGWSEYRKRQNLVPLTDAGQFRRTLLGLAIPGSPEPLILESADVRIAVAGFAGETERVSVRGRKRQGFRLNAFNEVLEALSDADADIRILVVRGGLEEVDFPAGLVDLIVFTGKNSPAGDMAGGGRTGGHLETTNSQEIPWLALATRGNGLARVVFDDSDVNIELISLERGFSEESPRILKLGDGFMEALTETALAAAAEARGEKYTGGGEAREQEKISATYWYPYGCKECEVFLWKELPRIEEAAGKRVLLTKLNSSNPDDFEALLDELSRRDEALEFLPLMIVGDAVLQGNEAIHDGLIDYLMDGGSARTRISGASTASGEGAPSIRVWEPGAVFFAGLLDGVNPCAFSAMVFLISALALVGGSRKKMLFVGMAYAFGVFVTYTLLGAGLLGGLRQIALRSGLRNILEYGFVVFLLVLAVFSVVDGYRLSRGRNDLLLKLPDSVSKRIHSLIREELRDGAAVGGALLLGAVVALLELGCTGQVYLPTIAWMISRGDGGSPWAWLFLYNIAFIIPLLIVFVLSYRGMKAVKLVTLFRQRGAVVKYSTAGIFVVLAVFVFFF